MIEITLFSPFIVKTQKTEKSRSKVGTSGLLIVLGLLIIVGGLLIFIIVFTVGMSIRGAYVKDGQLSKSQRCIGVGDGWGDK
jgi:hypothetical protein